LHRARPQLGSGEVGCSAKPADPVNILPLAAACSMHTSDYVVSFYLLGTTVRR
jgi:hypothetical protein